MRELSLFTGIGGGLLGTHLLGWRCVGAVEIDEYCCDRLEQRRDEGHFGYWFPVWRLDIREFNTRVAEQYAGMVDVISAGFPCQPFSVAGKRRGEADERNMWPATLECIRTVRPRYAFLENVSGLVASGYLDRIISDLTQSRYDCRWRILSAAEVGAPHKRDRLWIVAMDTNTAGKLGEVVSDTMGDLRRASGNNGRIASTRGGDEMANPAGERCNTSRITGETILRSKAQQRFAGCGSSAEGWWLAESGLGGTFDGLPEGVVIDKIPQCY